MDTTRLIEEVKVVQGSLMETVLGIVERAQTAAQEGIAEIHATKQRLTDELAVLSAEKRNLEDGVERTRQVISTEQRLEQDRRNALKAETEAAEARITVLKQEERAYEDKAATAKAEYEKQSHKLFAIAQKTDELEQKEAFIRAMYDKAGVPYA